MLLKASATVVSRMKRVTWSYGTDDQKTFVLGI